MTSNAGDLTCLMLLPRAGGAGLLEALRTGAGREAVAAAAAFDDVAEPATAATVLREPASRLLSLYAALRTADGAPATLVAAADQPLEAFLQDPRAAAISDNALARQVLGADDRLPGDGFLDPADAEGVATDVIARLDTLASVAILEVPGDAWSRIGRLAGAELDPPEAPAPAVPTRTGGLPFASITAAALELLDDRCAADALVYDHFLLPRVADEDAARRVAETALVRQLVRFGDQGGHAAARAAAVAGDAEAAGADRDAARRARDETRAALAGIEAERDEARAALATVETERDEARAALATAEAAREETRAALLAAEGERDDARAALSAAEGERDGARADADAARTQLASVQDDVNAADGDLGVVEAARDAAVAELADVRKQLDAIRTREAQAAARGSEIERRHAAQDAELAELRARLAEATGTATWQVTAPLRAVEGRLGRLIRR